MPRNSQRGSNNNNPSGRNQYSSNGWVDSARERPMATAAAAAAAVGAGVFLWSKRNQISDQISNLSGQISDWAEDMRSGSSSRELAMTEGPNESSAIESSRATASRGSKGSSSSRSTGSRSSRQTMNAGTAQQGVTH
ncbi:MAG TPA: hypothetical protein VFP53_02890 [Sphingomicrobium sp.]|nr:hypothetical protein [Sphingomicrobium sp.]